MCHSFILVCGLNALEMTTSVLLQSLGKVFKATMLSFTRQIILLIPISLLFSLGFGWGIYGVLYAGLVADILTFIFASIVYVTEYKSLSKEHKKVSYKDEETEVTYKGKQIIVTIAREYGSGGRFVGQLLAKDLGVKFYDKELINLAAKESGLSEAYVGEEDEKKTTDYINNNDDLIFLAEQKVIKDIAKKESCVIVGRLAGHILKSKKNVLRVFIYNSEESKVERAVKYFGVPKKDALKTVRKINKDRKEYYKYYTETELNDMNNYDICFNSDLMSVEEIAAEIKNIALKKA